MSSGFNFFADEVAYRAQTGRQAAASLGRRAHVRGRGQASKVRLDLDNCIKVALDALIGIAYEDDSQVVRLTAEIGEPVEGGGLSVTWGAA